VLLTDDFNVKVIDFGFTREYNDRNLLDTYCGSVAYAAPEMISGRKYSGPQADIWSLGTYASFNFDRSNLELKCIVC
jgi:serine/threonine protein kinase